MTNPEQEIPDCTEKSTIRKNSIPPTPEYNCNYAVCSDLSENFLIAFCVSFIRIGCI